MQFCLVLMCVVVPLSLFPVIRGDDYDFSGNGEFDYRHSPVRNHILFHDRFGNPSQSYQSIIDTDMIDVGAVDTEVNYDEFSLPKRYQKFIDKIDDQAEYQESPNMRARINYFFKFRTNQMVKMEERINILIQSNRDVVDMINELNTKVDSISQTENMQSAGMPPKNNVDSVDSHEILNILLYNIYQYITSSSSVDSRPELLEPQTIQHFITTAIENADKSLRNFNQVLENSRTTMRSLDKLTNMIQVIDERTRKYDGFSVEPCNCARSKRLNNNVASERTYQDLKRNTNKVIFEPNSYNCHDLTERRNGVYKFGSQEEVANEAGRFLNERYCEFNTDGPAWTVIQRRDIDQENFNRTWMDYKLGFGELDEEFWFGNEFIHILTSDEDMELRIIVEDSSGQQEWAEYSLFRVNEEGLNYNLEIGDYNGSVENVFMFQVQDFSTYDRQNDNNDNISCASLYGRGWWFNNCAEPADHGYKGFMLDTWLGTNFLKSLRMMIRPKGLWSGKDRNKNRAYISTSIK